MRSARLARQAKAIDVAARAVRGHDMHFFKGDYPQEVAEDRHFFLLFQEWKKNGGRDDDPIVQTMRARWNHLTKTGEA